MPTYDYACDKCGYEFEYFQSMKDSHLTDCPECKENSLRRLLGSGAGIIFKGTGFYETDYKKKTPSSSEKSETSSSSKSESKSSETGSKNESSNKSETGGKKEKSTTAVA